MLTLQELKLQYAQLKLFKFPQKKWFANFATSTIEKRRKDFEEYLSELVRKLSTLPGRTEVPIRAHLLPFYSFVCNHDPAISINF